MVLWLRIILGSLVLLLAGVVYYFWIYRTRRDDKKDSVVRK